MNRYKTAHPDAECLLQYADGELSNRHASHVRAHLEACWRCRANVEDLRETINEYVRYEQAMFDAPHEAPGDCEGFERRLDRLIGERQTASFRRAFPALLTKRKALIATVAALAVACLAAVELRHLPPENRSALTPTLRMKGPSHDPAPVPREPATQLGQAQHFGRQTKPEANGPALELKVVAALHGVGADLGEQIELSRDDAGRLIVTGTGLAPERRAAIEDSMSALPGVSLRFRQPKADLSKTSTLDSSQSGPAPVSPDALRAKLESMLGGAAGFSRFTDQALETSGALIVETHNLRNLASRFSPEVEEQFDRSERATLVQLQRDYIDVLSRKAADLQALMDPVLVSLGATGTDAVVKPTTPTTWQAATETLFAAAQMLDRALTTLLVGTNGEHPPGIAEEAGRSLKQLRIVIDSYQAITDGAEKQQR